MFNSNHFHEIDLNWISNFVLLSKKFSGFVVADNMVFIAKNKMPYDDMMDTLKC